MSKQVKDFAYVLSNYLSVYLPGMKGVSPNTILSYRDTFSLFLWFCKEQRGISPERLSFQQMDRTLVEDFLNWLETDRNCSISTRNQRLAALRAFFRYLQIHHPEQLLLCQQMIQIPSKKAQEKAMGYLSLEGLELLLSIPDTSSRQGRRDLVLLSLLYDTGARVQEIVDLCCVDVRAQNPATERLSGKGGNVRIVPLSTDMSKLLRSYMEEQAKYGQAKETYPLFTNRSGEKMTRAGVAYILKKYMDAARSSSPGILPERFSPHCLRHSKAMHLLQAGVNLVYIRDLLGHTDLRTTEIYARAETKAKREALEAASPIKSESQFPSWTDDNSLISWLQSFGHSNS